MLFVAIGAKIMLLENIWPEKGLVNGATEIADDIVRDTGMSFFIFTLFFNVILIFFKQ